MVRKYLGSCVIFWQEKFFCFCFFVPLCFYSVKYFIAALLKAGSCGSTKMSINKKIKRRHWDLRVGKHSLWSDDIWWWDPVFCRSCHFLLHRRFYCSVIGCLTRPIKYIFPSPLVVLRPSSRRVEGQLGLFPKTQWNIQYVCIYTYNIYYLYVYVYIHTQHTLICIPFKGTVQPVLKRIKPGDQTAVSTC